VPFQGCGLSDAVVQEQEAQPRSDCKQLRRPGVGRDPIFPLQLTTNRLTLEPLTVAHAPLLHPGFADPSLYKWIPNDPLTLAELTAKYERIMRGPRDNPVELWRNFAARLNGAEPPTYVGEIETSVFPGDYVYLAYFIFTPWQGQDFSHEACSAVLAHVRETFAIKRVVIEMDIRNTASWKLAESLGGKRVATKPDADFFKGESSDEYHYEIIL
jgi:[ribosomal protein S5]-alanine N-acetyltransferase